MSEPKSFQCPNCGSPVMTEGAASEVKCAYCGSTVIVPEELREQIPQVPQSIEINFPQTEPMGEEVVDTLKTAGKVTAGVTAVSVIIPIAIACVVLGAVGGILFFVFNTVRSATSSPTSPAVVQVYPTEAPAPTEVPTPTFTPLPTPAPFAKVLFTDNFTNPKSGWSRSSDADYVLEYKNGKYHILVNKQDGGQATWISNSYTDMSVEVDVQETQGPSDASLGVSCRNADDGRMYSFEFSPEGSYGIYKYSTDGSADALDEGSFGTSLLNSNGINHVQGVCVGDTLSFLLNSQLLSQVQDSDLPSGGTGLIVRTGNSGDPGVDVLFSNYVVKGP